MKEKLKSLINLDGFVNILTGQGVKGLDKQVANQVVADAPLQQKELESYYTSNGFGSKTVDLQATEMVREWFDVTNDTDGDVNNYLVKIKAKAKILQAIQYNFIYGGSAIIPIIEDGGDLDEPLNMEGIRSIKSLNVFHRFQFRWNQSDLDTDVNSVNFGKPSRYTLTPTGVNASAGTVVHASRMIIFWGQETTPQMRSENRGWGMSLFQAIKTELLNLTGSYGAIKSVIDDFQQTIISVEGLQQMVASGNSDLIRKRINILDLGRHVMNTVWLDANEKFSKQASSVSGLPQVMEQFILAYSSVTGIPVSILMGQAPKGLNATGDEDIRNWYDRISHLQESQLLDQLNQLITMVMNAKDFKPGMIDGWAVVFRDLWQPTEKELVETRKQQAESDQIYIQNGVLGALEVRQSRFGGTQYSIDTNLEDNDFETPEEDEE